MAKAVHRGASPPAPEEGGTWVPAPRSRDLVVPPGALFDALEGEGAARERLEGIARVIYAERRQTLETLKESFAGSARDPAARARFLRAFLEVMREGEYVSLDAATYDRATAQRFLVDIPVRVSWSALDPTWLTEAKRDPDLARGLEAAQAPEAFEDRALFFYRGFTPLEVRGWYVAAKIDLALAGIVRGLLRPFARLFGAAAPPATPASADRWLRRVGLSDTPWWSGLLRPTTLYEPCFRQVLLLYRPTPEDDEDAPGLALKLFRDIPLADAEMVFPERRLGIRTLDVALMVGTGLVAAPAVVKAVSGGSGTAIALATVLGGYAAKLVGQYLQKRRQHRARLTATLYDKSQDTDVGVLQYLVDAAVTQSTAEVALVTHHLEAAGPSTPEALDARIEAWLAKTFGIDPDYDVEDALDRASALGLVEVDEEGRYRAAGADEGQRALQARWRELGEG